MSANRRQTGLDPIYNFEGMVSYAAEAGSVDAFCSMSNRLQQYISIREYILYHRKDIAGVFDRHKNAFSRFESINPNFPVYRLQKTINKENKVRGVIAVVPGSQDNISRLVTISLAGFWEHAVRRLVKKYLYPDALPVYFKQSEIAEAFMALENSLPEGQSIYLSDVTSRQERVNQKRAINKNYDTHRIWTDTPWREVFSKAAEENQWFTGLKFKIKKQMKSSDFTVAAGKIYKKGEIHLDFYYDIITNSLVNVLEEKAAQRLSLLQDRGIRERNYKHSNPIEIAFDFDAFRDTEDIKEFGRIMSAYPNSARAVYHGNPYYHANIADTRDGSSFEIWVLTTDKIMIVPQAKSSAEAFERLIAYVFSSFHEGIVNEYTTIG